MTLTRSQQKIIEAGASIMLDTPSDEDRAYMARQLVQATLPHSNPGNVEIWTRTNGNLTLAIQPGFDIKKGKREGIPYGTVPRLLLFWLTTEALQKGSPKIELGHSMADFMRQLGLDPSRGGARSDARRLQDQAARLFRAKISFLYDVDNGDHGLEDERDMLVSERRVLWWDDRSPEQGALWGSWIELSDRFFKAITSAPVPVDMRALRALKRSPLALDLYSWLTYEAFRAHRKGRSRFVSWGLLMKQLGTDYADETNFRRKVKASLTKIRTVYPGLKLGKKVGGIEVLPTSLAAIQPAPTIAAASR